MSTFVSFLLFLAIQSYSSDAASMLGSPPSPGEELTRLRSVVKQLGRQLMQQELYVEERTRSDGHSGIKQIRMRKDGQQSYNTATWTDKSVNAIHDHSDHINTCGMGEVIAVLNGVEFRTRHNDYKLKRPSTSSSEYHVTEDIPYPDIPQQVLSKPTVDEQIVEMREFFRAWRDGNTTHRNYLPYFRPNLCYLEGAFTNDLDIEEPFDSDRHQLEADSWFELQEQIRFTSSTGDKDNQENYAYLPTKIMSVLEDGTPVFGQWNYRILCHPVQGEIKLSELVPVDNLANRMTEGSTFKEYVTSRATRFSLQPEGQPDTFVKSRLDELMAQIPGKNNYGVNMTDDSLGLTKYQLDRDMPLNTGVYNRWYRVVKKGAMGNKQIHRGFSDRNLFVAQTTHNRVAPVSLQHCDKPKRRQPEVCETATKRVSYAIPLEIVFTTPLNSWNPYDIQYKGEEKTPLGRTVRADGRNGRVTVQEAFNGTNHKNYYMTPVEFFSGREVDKDSADTTRGSVGVLDKQGNLREVKASGIRIFLPEIAGLGVIRTRYPISPVHAEGSPMWKEVEALRELVMNMQTHLHIFQSTPGLAATNQIQAPRKIVLATSSSSPDPVGLHSHTLQLTKAQDDLLRSRPGQSIVVTTSEENGHSHELEVKYNRTNDKYFYKTCDGEVRCFDRHTKILIPRTDSSDAP